MQSVWLIILRSGNTSIKWLEMILRIKAQKKFIIFAFKKLQDVYKRQVVHNPESNMGNACGCPPTMEIVHRGILTGLGTDGYTQDILESYKVANVLHKHHLCDANAAWGEVPQMLFEGNAKIANRYFKKQLGVLKEGAAADVIVTDYIPRTPMNASNVNSHILFGMTGRSVVTTVCNGKILMKDRELLGIDEEKVLYEVRNAAADLAKSING